MKRTAYPPPVPSWRPAQSQVGKTGLPSPPLPCSSRAHFLVTQSSVILTRFYVADVADKSEQTALIKACTKNGAGLEMAQLLLAHKADLTPTDNKVRRKKRERTIHKRLDSKQNLRPCVMHVGDVGV